MSGLLHCLTSTGNEFLEASFIGVQCTANKLSDGFNTSFEEVDIESAVSASQLFISELWFIDLIPAARHSSRPDAFMSRSINSALGCWVQLETRSSAYKNWWTCVYQVHPLHDLTTFPPCNIYSHHPAPWHHISISGFSLMTTWVWPYVKNWQRLLVFLLTTAHTTILMIVVPAPSYSRMNLNYLVFLTLI